MKDKALESYLITLAHYISGWFFDHPWTPDRDAIVKSIPGRVIESIMALERAGFNTGEKDWVCAVQSKRFLDGKETVARILAYPSDPGKNSEPLKLLRTLGLDHADAQKQYCLNCGIAIPGIVEEELEHAVWQQAAELAATCRTRIHVNAVCV